MKIIAHSGRDLYLVEASGLELSCITGGQIDWNPSSYNMSPVGTRIPVGALWDRLKDLRSREIEVKRTAASLRALADLIDGKIAEVIFPEQKDAVA